MTLARRGGLPEDHGGNRPRRRHRSRETAILTTTDLSKALILSFRRESKRKWILESNVSGASYLCVLGQMVRFFVFPAGEVLSF